MSANVPMVIAVQQKQHGKRLLRYEDNGSNKRIRTRNPANAVVEPETKNRNSAAMLSLWQCILSWFYMTCEEELARDRVARDTMKVLYRQMEALRHTITSKALYLDVNHIVSDFRILVKKIDQKRWNSVIKSMMHELMEMLRVLKGNKDEFLKDWGMDDFNKQDDVKFKQIACLLILWYWLAAWSESDGSGPELQDAKEEYFHRVELYSDRLIRVFFLPCEDDDDDNNDQTFYDIQEMTFSLVVLVRADPQHWIDVLDHFIHRMAHAGSLRGQVKNVWSEARAKRDEELKSLGVGQSSEANGNANGQNPNGDQPEPEPHSEPLLVHGLGMLLKNVVSRTPLHSVADKIPDAVSLVYDDLKKGDLMDIAGHIPNVVGEIAGPEAKQIAQAVVDGTEYVTGHVVDEVKEIGHVLGEGVHEFSKGVHTAFHSVKNFFSHLF